MDPTEYGMDHTDRSIGERGLKVEDRLERYVQLKDQVRRNIPIREEYTDEEVRKIIFEVLSAEDKQRSIRIRNRVWYARRIFNALRRLDILTPFLEDESVTEIMCNGPEQIYIEKRGLLTRTEERFESGERLEDVIQQIVGQVNRTVNEANPIVDARLTDGSRVNAVLAPIAINGPILTIRKFRDQPITMEELISWGTLSREAADFLEDLVRRRYNIFVCGGTGSGKTTLLNILSNSIPPKERIITIEDAAELQLTSIENLVTLETRKPNVEGKGEITIRDLIRSSLRMRPDRIIVGEIRGEEAMDMLQALNTGHEGSLSTGHSNSCKDMLARIESMVLQGVDYPIEAIRQQIASAIDILVSVTHMPDGTRRLMEIVQICGYQEGKVLLEPLYIRKEGVLMRTEFTLYRNK